MNRELVTGLAQLSAEKGLPKENVPGMSVDIRNGDELRRHVERRLTTGERFKITAWTSTVMKA